MKKYYDAVIVGCGVAGCFAALHLPQEADILMITKADTEDSDSFLAQGGICVLKNESDYDAFYEDTMHAGHYENTPESVDIMIRSSRNVINQLIAWQKNRRSFPNGCRKIRTQKESMMRRKKKTPSLSTASVNLQRRRG